MEQWRSCPKPPTVSFLVQKLALLTCPVLVWYVWPYLISHCACVYNQLLLPLLLRLMESTVFPPGLKIDPSRPCFLLCY